MNHLLTLLKKDLRLELRGKETLSLMLSLALLLGVVASVAVESSQLKATEVTKLYPGLLWLVFLFSSSITLGRSFDAELENHAMDGMLLTPVDACWFYVSKVLTNCVMVGCGQILNVLIISVLLNVDVSSIWLEICVISILVVIAYSAVATLLAALSATSRLKTMLLPLILLPLMFPLFFCAIELTAQALSNGKLEMDSVWLSFLLALDTLYLALGFNLYEFVLRD